MRFQRVNQPAESGSSAVKVEIKNKRELHMFLYIERFQTWVKGDMCGHACEDVGKAGRLEADLQHV